MTYKEPIRYSGYRISLLPEQQQRATWEARLGDIQWLLPMVKEALKEPFFLDDALLNQTFEEIIKGAMLTGELFGCVHGEGADRKVVGFVLLQDVRPGRDAVISAWAHPEFRSSYTLYRLIKRIMDYAFRPWNPERTEAEKQAPRGLGLRKLKANISGENLSAAKALRCLGFLTFGVSLMDGLFKGRVTDIILLEKFNPAILPKQEPANARKLSQGADPAHLHPATGIPSAAELPASTSVHAAEPSGEPVRTVRAASGGESAGGGERARARRESRLKQLRQRVDEPKEQSDRPELDAGSPELLPANAGDAADGSRRVSTKRKRSTRK